MALRNYIQRSGQQHPASEVCSLQCRLGIALPCVNALRSVSFKRLAQHSLHLSAPTLAPPALSAVQLLGHRIATHWQNNPLISHTALCCLSPRLSHMHRVTCQEPRLALPSREACARARSSHRSATVCFLLPEALPCNLQLPFQNSCVAAGSPQTTTHGCRYLTFCTVRRLLTSYRP